MDYQGLEELKLIDQYLKKYNETIVNFFTKKIEMYEIVML